MRASLRRAWRAAPGLLALGLGAAAVAPGPAAATEFRYDAVRDYSDLRGGGAARFGVGDAVDLAMSGEGSRVVLRLPTYAPRGAAPDGTTPLEDAAPALPRRRSDGALGDIRLTFGQELVESEDGEHRLGIALQTRLPSATAASLGSGRLDQVLRLEATSRLAEGVTLDVSFGRRFAVAPRRSAAPERWVGTGTLAFELDDGWTVGVMLDAQDRGSARRGPVVDIGGFIERAVADDLTIGLVAWQGTGAGGDGGFAIGVRLAHRASFSFARADR